MKTKTSQEWAATVATLQEKRASLCAACDSAKAAAEAVALTWVMKLRRPS